MRLFVLVPFLLVPFWSAPLHAAAPDPPAPASFGTAIVARGEPLPAWADPLLPIPATNSQDALVMRLSEIQVWTGSGPTAVLYNRAIQVNHRAGLGEIGQYALQFLPAYQRLSLHRVALLRGAAVIDVTATVGARMLERESEHDQGMDVGVATVQLLLDDVRVGDTLWITYTITGDNPVFGGHWGDWFQWDTGWPVAQRRLTVSHPANRPLYWRQLGDMKAPAVTPTVERRGAIERLRFDGRDIAPVEFESRTPDSFIPMRLIALSDFASWHDVAAWATALFPSVPPSPQVTALAAQFKTAGDQAAQAAAALRWVQDEIRYFSVSIGENSHRPHAPDTVLARRYGDCKDKTYLLIGILQALGIAAEPVLLNASAPGYPARMAPTQSAFDHAIVRLHIADHAYFVDPTQTGQRGDLAQMAPDFPDASVLIVAAATQALTALPERAAGAPSYERVESFTVADFKGSALLDVRAIYRNRRADAARRKFGIMRVREVANEVLAHYERQYPGVTLVGTPTLVDTASDGSYEVRARLSLPAAVRKVEQRYVLDYDSQLLDGTLGLPDKLVRQFPFSFPAGKVDARYRLQVQWPENVRVRSPDVVHVVDHAYFNMRESFSMLGNRVDFILDYQLKRDQVAAADLPEFQRAIHATQGMFSGGFNTDGGDDGDGTRSLSMRDALAEQQLRGMRAARQQATPAQIGQWDMADLCWQLRSATSTFFLQTADERSATQQQRGAFVQDERPGANGCRGQLGLQEQDARASAGWFAKETLANDDRLHLQSAWARLHAGQPDAALAEAMAYIGAASASGKLNGTDLAMAISLHVRANKAVPAVLRDTYVLPADGPWPAPLLAWQRGTLTDAALLAAIGDYAPDARTLAANDAWFHIGVRRLAAKDTAGAAQAFGWYQADGVGATLPYALAGIEREAGLQDPDLLAGSALSEQRQDAQAVAAWTKAAGRGNVAAQAWLGVAYAEGRGVARDTVAARRLLEPAGRAGSGRALSQLAILDLDDEHGDHARGMDYIEQAAATGYPYALFYLSSLQRRGYATSLDAAGALDMERRAAEMNFAGAQSAQAFRYLYGTGVPRDDDLARYWANRTIVNGNDTGYAVLARVLMRGTADDQRAGVNIVRTLADAGDIPAMLAMAHAAMHGVGMPVDRAAGRAWYVKAQQKSTAENMGVFSSRIERWGGGDSDAFDSMLLAAESGEVDAQAAMGWKYRTGLGTGVDLAASVRWLREAARQGSLTAMNNLGDAYETGQGVAQDIGKAMALYRQAAEGGGDAAFGSLASVYEKGVGIAPDPRLAYTYMLLQQRYLGTHHRAAVDARCRAMAGQLPAADAAQARAAAQAWQPGHPLPGAAVAAG